jgi:hypothetical protein
VPGRVTAWRSPAHVALLALAGAGVLAGGVAGVTVAGSVYPGAAPMQPAAPAIIAQQRAAPAVRASLAIGATSAASRWPTPLSTAATRRRGPLPRHHRRHRVVPAARPATQVIAVRAAPAPVAPARRTAAATPRAVTPQATGGGAVSAPVTRPAPVVVRPAPSVAPIRAPAPKPAARAPRPTAAFDDSG